MSLGGGMLPLGIQQDTYDGIIDCPVLRGIVLTTQGPDLSRLAAPYRNVQVVDIG